MKNTEKNKNKWVEKVKSTLELGGKSEKTFHNYKSHINRFLNSFSENIEINKLSEDKIADYFIKNYIQKNNYLIRLSLLLHNLYLILLPYLVFPLVSLISLPFYYHHILFLTYILT